MFCHKQEDVLGYRYICGNLVFNKLCSAVDLAKALRVNRRNIERYAAAKREDGLGCYLNKKDRREQCHKMLPEIFIKAQELLDSGKSQLKNIPNIGCK